MKTQHKTKTASVVPESDAAGWDTNKSPFHEHTQGKPGSSYAKASEDKLPQHSPLPWRVFTRYVMSNGRFLATAHAIGDSGSAFKGFANGQEPTQSMNEAEANAKLIVRSVNHAEALAEALRELRDAYQKMFDVMPVAWQTYDDLAEASLAQWAQDHHAI